MTMPDRVLQFLQQKHTINKVIPLWLFISFFSLTACSNKPEVHIFSTHISTEQSELLVQSLSEKKMNVHVNTLPFPANVNDNTLIYGAGLNNSEIIKPLIKELAALGYDIKSANLISQNNHKFTGNNVGIYLLPDNYVKSEKEYVIQLENEYGSEICRHSALLTLGKESNFVLEMDIWDEVNEQYLPLISQGKWQHNNENIITLSTKGWAEDLVFERKMSIKQRSNVKLQVVRLSPLKANEELPKELKLLNCSYSISMVM